MIDDSFLRDKVELVITPPEQFGIKLAYQFCTRTTLGVLTQLIAQAETHIVIASPFLQINERLAISPLVAALKHALDRNIRVDVICTGAGIDNFKQEWAAVLCTGRVCLFRPKPNINDERLLGSHAKVIISDGQHAYIGSANLTYPGLTGNLEIGVLVHGNIASKAAAFLSYLMDIGYLIEVPL
jgi:phosphatidylserine/phosphatidylglycerophosphate/cardiolipin synthase-like enzyme